jgi:hypothetical protein
MKRAKFQSIRVHVGDYDYDAIARVIPARDPHVSADSPDYLKVTAARVQIMRILRNGVEPDNMMPWTRSMVERLVREKVQAGGKEAVTR